MRPLVIVFALFVLLALAACQSGPGPSSALDVHPALGAGVRVFAGPQDGVGVDARLDLGKYGCRTGKASEPALAPAPPATEPYTAGACSTAPQDPGRAPDAPALGAATHP